MIPDSRQTMVALVVAMIVCEIEMLIIPLILSGISDMYQLNEGMAGLITSCHTGAFAVSTLVLAPYINRLNRKSVSFFGVMLIALGSLGTMAGMNIILLAICRVLAGMGEGMIAAIAFSAAAESTNSHRTFSIMYFFAIASSIAGFFGVSYISANFGPEWMFAYVTVAALAGLPFILGIPDTDTGETYNQSSIRDIISFSNIVILLSYLLFYVGVLAVWFYIERIGRQIGLTTDTIGQFLGIAAFIGLSGPVLSNWYGTSKGITLPLAAGYITCGVGCLVICYTASSTVYYGNIIMVNIVLMFTVPYIMSLLAEQDKAGRLTVVGRGIGAIAHFIAPALAGGILLLEFGYAGIGWMAFGIIITGILMLLPIARKADVIRDRLLPQSVK